MAFTRFDYSKFEVYTIKGSRWWDEHRKTDLKCHDPEGFFGAPRYDYFIYANTREEVERGSSRPYVLIHTAKSIDRMNLEIKTGVRNRMDNFGIDIDRVVDQDMVIIAKDVSGSAIGGNSASFFFKRRQ